MRLFKAKIIKPCRIKLGGPELKVGEIVEVPNQTLGVLITRQEAVFYEEEAVQAEEEATAEAEETRTREQLKAILDENGVEYRFNAKTEKLEELAKEFLS